MYKCKICGFECFSEKVYQEHMHLHSIGKTEREVLKEIRIKQKQHDRHRRN